MVAYLLVGIPGSGKSTWAHEMSIELEKLNATSIIVSRDEIRKNFIGENEYFSRETEVFNEFINQINEAMMKYDCVFIDATHISPASRRKVISKLTPPDNSQLFIKVMETPFLTCVKRNMKREGFAHVPLNAIERMHNQISLPTKKEFEAKWNPFKEVFISTGG